MSQQNAAAPSTPDAGDSRRLDGSAGRIVLILGVLGIALAIYQVFNVAIVVNGLAQSAGLGGIADAFGWQRILPTFIEVGAHYAMIGLFLAVAFLAYPATARHGDWVPWFDWAIAAAAIVVTLYFADHAGRIILGGWDTPPRAHSGIGEAAGPVERWLPPIAAAVLILIGLEGVRRCGGLPLLILCAGFAFYPLVADRMPGVLWGTDASLEGVFRLHVFGVDSILGVPMRVVLNLVIGYIVFGAALTATGGGEFFMNLAFALMGRSRGGPAKVAVVASGFFGSLSGSVVSNVITTGALTIPTMKRTGYPAHYAGAIEACASTGGALMPPVMGAVAFIMASFLNVPYSTVVIAAIVPALLFYLALILQADGYAARQKLAGLPPEALPSVVTTLREGWMYLFSLAALIWLLLGLRLDAFAAYYATGLLILTVVVFKPGRYRLWPTLMAVLRASAVAVGNLVAILAGVGLIVGTLTYTGVGQAFSSELVIAAGSNVYLLLAFGAFASFILGMGMTASACYIFLAIVLAPVLVEGGLNQIGSHLFILYWGMLSFITPPVALAAVAAAGIARSKPMQTGLTAMRLGAINFVLPFMFVLNPALILDAPLVEIVPACITAVIAVWLMAAGFEGWLYGVGRIGWFERAPLLVAALGLLQPGLYTDGFGALVLAGIYGWHFLVRRPRQRRPA